jgi:uncharacterized membrane protein
MNEGLLEDLAGSPGLIHSELIGLAHALEWVSDGIDIVSIAIMLVGAARFVLGFAAAELSGDSLLRLQAIDRRRAELGRYILSGLELLIVSDIIHTALSLAVGDLLFLALLVLIRATVGFFLDRELRAVGDGVGQAGR